MWNENFQTSFRKTWMSSGEKWIVLCSLYSEWIFETCRLLLLNSYRSNCFESKWELMLWDGNNGLVTSSVLVFWNFDWINRCGRFRRSILKIRRTNCNVLFALCLDSVYSNVDKRNTHFEDIIQLYASKIHIRP